MITDTKKMKEEKSFHIEQIQILGKRGESTIFLIYYQILTIFPN